MRTKLTITAIVLCAAVTACKHPVDAMLEWGGFYEATNGLVLELTTTGAIVRSTGNSGLDQMGLKVDQPFFLIDERLSDITWRGRGRVQSHFATHHDGSIQYWLPLEPVTATMTSSTLTFDNTPQGSRNFTRQGSGGNSGDSGADLAGEVILNQVLEGDRDARISYKVTLPAGVRKLEVVLSEAEHGRNTADLFVRRGTPPTVSRTPTYSWVADCASVRPNREREVCTFNNPASGEWHILVFGYHAFWGTRLTVTIWK
jgi:hypothetical protein